MEELIAKEALQDEAYRRGLFDAWKAARHILTCDPQEREDIYNAPSVYDAIMKHSAYECIQRKEKWNE